MRFLVFLSETAIPMLIFVIVGTGILNHQKVYEEFVQGAADGFKTVAGILPTLIGLMVAVGVLRASGLLDAVVQLGAVLTDHIGFPAESFPSPL